MKTAVLFFAAALLVAGSYASDDPTGSLPGVQDLTPDNFDKVVNGAKFALVEFYAPWCGHCKRMTPEFKALGERVAKDGALASRVVVAKVNADEHRSLGERFEVRGFPTIKLFVRGKAPTKDTAVNYEGARTADAFVKYLTDKLAADRGFARVKALAALAAKAGAAETGDALKAAVKELEAAAAKVTGKDKDNAAIYAKLAKKAAEKGVDFFKLEAARLERMIGSGSVAAAKVEEMARKVDVLGAFLPGAEEEDKAAAAGKDDEDEDEEEDEEEEEDEDEEVAEE